ncbi:MAG: rubrerythrin family protein [Candidatus Coatesbacteria bacterium]|nr:rubrerythrin family protein [Candidatus Coatesbacteria bacterium]
MRKMTEEFLWAAFCGESKAHMKYAAYADKAAKEGKPNIAKLFRAISYAERVHATNHFKALKALKGTAENLQDAIAGESFEVEEMYPAYDAVAKLQDEHEAEHSIHYAIEAEKIHEQMYRDAKAHAEKDDDWEIGDVYICPNCGFTHIVSEKDPLPEVCPVCKWKKSTFKKFDGYEELV